MAARAVFDLHCDTLTALMSSGRRAGREKVPLAGRLLRFFRRK